MSVAVSFRNARLPDRLAGAIACTSIIELASFEPWATYRISSLSSAGRQLPTPFLAATTHQTCAPDSVFVGVSPQPHGSWATAAADPGSGTLAVTSTPFLSTARA